MDLDRDQDRGLKQERCLERLMWSVQQLQGKLDPTELGKLAELIIQTMSGPWRYFHTSEHIFEVGESGDAIEVLAALFHDLVYVQVDQGVSVNISRYIAPFVKELHGQLVILPAAALPDDPMFDLVTQIFGFAPEQVLIPTAGQNEYLSALIAARCLSHALSPATIAQIAACIEATIPFRPVSESGQTAGDRLYERLLQTNQRFGFGWTPADVIDIVRRAIRLANRDVKNFAYPSSADFLDNTWNLLPETNHDLISANSYTVSGYRLSLQKMEGFMNFLKPEWVFQQFQNEPDEQTYHRLVVQTRKNLEVARLYLGSKLLTIAIIEALSRRIGREVPVATMMGELPWRGILTAQLENFLPAIQRAMLPMNSIEQEVLDVLENGRNQASDYDIKNSPVTTYIVKTIGFERTQRLLLEAKEFFKGNVEAEDFLKHCEPEIVDTLVKGVVQVLESRKQAMSGLHLSRL